METMLLWLNAIGIRNYVNKEVFSDFFFVRRLLRLSLILTLTYAGRRQTRKKSNSLVKWKNKQHQHRISTQLIHETQRWCWRWRKTMKTNSQSEYGEQFVVQKYTTREAKVKINEQKKQKLLFVVSCHLPCRCTRLIHTHFLMSCQTWAQKYTNCNVKKCHFSLRRNERNGNPNDEHKVSEQKLTIKSLNVRLVYLRSYNRMREQKSHTHTHISSTAVESNEPSSDDKN